MSAARTSGRASGRLATRLAWRELRRRPLRAVLVVLLVAVPVFALTVADVLVETGTSERASDRFFRDYGDADVVYLFDGATPSDAFAPPFPNGTTELRFRRGDLPLTPLEDQGQRRVGVLNAAFGDRPDLAGLQLLEGRAPRPGAGEVAVSINVANWLDASVGDTVSFSRPEFRARVTGIVRPMADFADPVIDAPDFDWSVVREPGFGRSRIAIDVPSGFAVRRSTRDGMLVEVARGAQVLGEPALPVATPLFDGSDPGWVPTNSAVLPASVTTEDGIPTEARFWSWVGAALLLAMISVIIAAAFATTARRQLVTLGQLAANGSDQRFLRRMLTRQGTMLGVVGAVVGVGSAAVALIVSQGWIESLYRHELHYAWAWDLLAIGLTAVVAATIAARFPARSTSRIPVLAALAGRRPLGPIPKLRWLKATIVFATGVALLLLVGLAWSNDTAQITAVVAIAGGLFVLAGAAYMTPVVLTLLARVASEIGAAPRLAARSLVRVRSRSAAILTSIAVVGALAMAVLTAMLGLGVDRAYERSVSSLPEKAILIRNYNTIGAEPAGQAEIEARVAAALPGASVTSVRGAPGPDLFGDSLAASAGVVVLEPDQRWLLPNASRSALARSGAIASDYSTGYALGYAGPSSDVGPVTVELETTDGMQRVDAARADLGYASGFASGFGPTLIVTPERAAELGVPETLLGYAGLAPDPITQTQSEALSDALTGGDPYVDGSEGGAGFSVITRGSFPEYWRGFWTTGRLQLWFTIAALLFVLVVVAIALLLGSAEARDERDVLEALGTPPRTERRMSSVKAMTLALGGGLLAVPAGFIPVAVVLRAMQKPDQFNGAIVGSSVYPLVEFPWITAIGVLVVVPLIVATLAWIATGMAQRTRPLRSAVFGAE